MGLYEMTMKQISEICHNNMITLAIFADCEDNILLAYILYGIDDWYQQGYAIL